MEFQNDFHDQFRNFGNYAQEPLEFTKHISEIFLVANFCYFVISVLGKTWENMFFQCKMCSFQKKFTNCVKSKKLKKNTLGYL